MSGKTWFKFVANALNLIKMSALSFPVCWALVSLRDTPLRYGADSSFFVLDYKWALVIAIGIGLVLAAWHGLAFEEATIFDAKQYLKRKQKYTVIGTENWNQEKFSSKVGELGNQKYWKLISKTDAHYRFETKRNHGLKDIVQVWNTASGVVVESKPKNWFHFVDMARNLKNVEYVSKYLRSNA
ncbi:MAG: hypothetical protein H6607_01670 [Flavobacteriales bacterium]|nr:hypothetical protein [Flavobacteriales bacterium]